MPRRSPPPERPTEASLHEAALAHLARYATTQAGLERVLVNRVRRWASRAGLGEDEAAEAIAQGRAAAARVVARLAAAGAVSDLAFAATRARRLARGGHSRAVIAAKLAAKGAGEEVEAALAEALPDREAELAAACIAARRRRIGPFAAEAPHDPASAAEARRRALAALARAGFPRSVAEAVLAMDAAEAEARIAAFRR
ncbi:RecX family transcriptional regulator [Elioraea tepida]|jgi:regulatory protein|uniref:RecX family transcriptional regulator n=1 Tax=Elioraea tepida TaxID=2843330 RepID=A0A975TZM0_9PROT|nr:RecX family transcriptional regulator [Elioraea tepida]QXM23430.1 RecX family transcriptional regulator [Elioraea tepida]